MQLPRGQPSAVVPPWDVRHPHKWGPPSHFAWRGQHRRKPIVLRSKKGSVEKPLPNGNDAECNERKKEDDDHRVWIEMFHSQSPFSRKRQGSARQTLEKARHSLAKQYEPDHKSPIPYPRFEEDEKDD